MQYSAWKPMILPILSWDKPLAQDQAHLLIVPAHPVTMVSPGM